MATYYARKSGNINATDVWATTSGGTAGDYFSSFTNADVLMANGFSITVNVNVTVAEIRNDAANSATSGGVFALSNGVTVTASLYGGGAGPAATVTTSGTVSASIVGNIYGNGHASNFLSTVVHGSTGTLTITGNAYSGTNQLGYAINNSSTGTVSMTGNLLAGSVAPGSGNYIAGNTGGGSFTITGNITGGAFSTTFAINSSTGTMTITGAVSGGSVSGAVGASNTSTGTLTINGSVTGGTAGVGATSTASGTMTINGTATGGLAAGVTVSSTGTVNVTRAKGGSAANSAVGVSNGTAGSVVNVDEIEYGDSYGASPTTGPIVFANKTSNVCLVYRSGGLSKKTLTDPNASGLMPAASNVRSGTVYNGGNSTGTCAVPAASSVAFGVPVDATTGTAALTPAAVWDYLTSSATTAGSMGERLKNAATVASMGQALSDALTP